MSSLADKNLPQSAQDEINRITAAAQAGQISWSDANKQANQVRAANGADYTVSASGTTTYNDNSTISNFKSGSQTSGGKAQSTIDNWNKNATVSTNNNDYYGGHVGLNADMSRNKNLAGMSVKQGQYTVTYDENGYAKKAVKDGGASATGYAPTTHANDSAWHQAAYQAAQMGDWDLVGQYLNKISETYGQTGTYDEFSGAPGVNLKAANLYEQELQNQFKYDDETYYNRRYDEAYGPNAAAVWDATGGAIKTYADLVNAVGAERAQQMVQNQIAKNPSVYQNNGLMVQGGMQNGAVLQGMTGPNNYMAGMESSVVNPYGQYGSFEDFLAGTGYNQYADATQQAIRAAVQQAISGYNQQIETTNDETEQLARQAYINMMMGGKNLDQQLAASGYAGGMADSQRIALQANYENDLNALERQRLATVDELQRAIANAQLSGDLQTAQELSSYLQQVQGQWVNYMQNQQAMANENYWMQQSLEADSQNRAREMALMIMQSGGMPDDETLNAAGISRAQAQALLGTTAAQVPAATTQRRTGGGYNNGGLTNQQVKQLQNYLGVTADGLWGSNSRNAAGGLTADEAWSAYNREKSIEQTVGMNRTAQGQVAAIQKLLESGQITEAEAEGLLNKFNLQ